MLDVGPARGEGDAHVRNGGAGEHAQVRLLRQVGQHQPLPAAVQPVLAARAGEVEPAAPGAGLQQEVDLSIVPQGLVVADAHRRGGDGLLVDDAPRAEIHLQAEALGDEPAQDLQLDLPHELEVDLPKPLVPDQVELGVLLLQQAQLVQDHVGVRLRGQEQLVVQHRLQLRRGGQALRPQPLAREGAGQAGDGAHRPRLRPVDGAVPAARVDPQLLRLLLPLLPRLVLAGDQILYRQCAAGDLQIGQPRPPLVPADFEHFGAEVPGVGGPGGVPLQPLEKFPPPLQLQRRSEPAGEQGPLPDEGGQGFFGECAALQILRQRLLAGRGRLLKEGLPGAAEVHEALPQAGAQSGEQAGALHAPAAHQIHLVDKEKNRHTAALQKLPKGAGVGLDAVGAADDQDGAVYHLQGPLHLRGEVHVARRVQQRSLRLPKGEDRLLGEDGDAPLPLQRLRVQEGVLVVHPAQGADGAGLIEQGLGQRGLPRVHVGQYPDNQFLHMYASPVDSFPPVYHSFSTVPHQFFPPPEKVIRNVAISMPD